MKTTPCQEQLDIPLVSWWATFEQYAALPSVPSVVLRENEAEFFSVFPVGEQDKMNSMEITLYGAQKSINVLSVSLQLSLCYSCLV